MLAVLARGAIGTRADRGFGQLLIRPRDR